MMKIHIGKVIGIAGILLMFPLSGIIGPWITITFFAHRMPNGERVILNIADGARGPAICFLTGFFILCAGTVIEIVNAFKKSNKYNRTPS